MGKLFVSVGGGGVDTDVVTAGAGDVLSGKVIVGPDGEPLTGTLALSGNATAAQVLSGKTFYNTDAKTILTGTMTDRGAQTKSFTPSASTQSYTVPAGYHSGSGKVTVAAIPSTYLAISSANFFKSGAYGDLYNKLGIIGKRPNLSGAIASSYDVEKGTFTDWLDITLPSFKTHSDGYLYCTGLDRQGWSTRKPIDITNISAIRFVKQGSASANTGTVFWCANPTTKEEMYAYYPYLTNWTTLDLDVSGLSGQCLFGMYRHTGNSSGSWYIKEISFVA